MEKEKMELTYVIKEPSEKSLKIKARGGVLNKKTLANFEKNIKLHDKKEIIIPGFSLHSNLSGWVYRAIDTSFATTYYTYNNSAIKTLNMTLDVDNNKNLDVMSFIENNFLKYLVFKNCVCVYAFVFACEKKQMPLVFLKGVHTEFLNKYEDKKVSIWSENQNTCDKKVLDVFWGNIISKEHLKKVSVEDIERFVGKNNVFSITPDLLWFNLPEDLLKFEFSKYSWKRKRIYRFFEKKQLIMS